MFTSNQPVAGAQKRGRDIDNELSWDRLALAIVSNNTAGVKRLLGLGLDAKQTPTGTRI